MRTGKHNFIRRGGKGLTLAEMIIAMAIMVIIMAAIMPQFRAIRNSWASSEASANMIQNGRVLQEHIVRNLSAAKRIVRVSSSSIANGFIIFKDSNDIEKRYMVSGGYVVFGTLGSEEQLAGIVSRFQISSYLIDPAITLTTDANSIRLVKIETIFTNSNPMGTDRTFLTSAYLRTNVNAECDMVAYWKLDDGSGTTAADSSGNGNNGTLINFYWPSWTTGIIDGGLEFDGWNDYVNCRSDSSLDITGDITIALWLRADNFRWEPDIVTKGSYSRAYSVWLSSSGRVVFALNNNWLTSNSAIPDDKWHHIAVTRGGSTRKIYIDGQEDVSDTYSSAIGTTSRPLTISTRSYPFNGTIDDVRLYGRALSPEEVEALATTLRYMGFNEKKEDTDVTSIAVPIPDGTSEGDLLIAAVATDDSTTFSTPGSDWKEIEYDSDSSEVTLGIWYKVAGGSEPGSYTFEWSGEQQAYGWMMRFTGHRPTNPIPPDWVESQSGYSQRPDCPAVTTTVDNCIILRLGAFDDDDIWRDYTGLSGHTTITIDESSRSGGTCSGGAGYKYQATAGDSDDADFSLRRREEYVTVTFAIAPDSTSIDDCSEIRP